MKKVLLSGLVFGALLFSACTKEETPVAGDEVCDANLKGYAKLPQQDQTSGDEVAFSWNAITASDFAHGKTPPFNNWEKPVVDGVYVYRVPEKVEDKGFASVLESGGGAALQKMYTDKKQQFGNGNDPVWIWFDLEQLEAIEEVCEDASLTVLVRYRSSNNVAFHFNLLEAARYCDEFGPISLDFKWTVYSGVYGVVPEIDLGEITQVRIQDPEYCGDNNKWKFCLEYSDWDPWCEDYTGCQTISLSDFAGFIALVEDDLADNQDLVGWVYAGTDTPFLFDDEPDLICEDTQIEPVIITNRCVTVVINGVETKECFPGDDECSPAKVDLGTFGKEGCKIVSWNGGEFEANFVLDDCIKEDLVFVADLKCLGSNTWGSVTAVNEGAAVKSQVVIGDNWFSYVILDKELLEDGEVQILDMVQGDKWNFAGKAYITLVGNQLTVTVDGEYGGIVARLYSGIPAPNNNGGHKTANSITIPYNGEGYLYVHTDGFRFYQ